MMDFLTGYFVYSVVVPDQIGTLGQVGTKTILAQALFDNLADAPDELSFRKGDIVTVIEQDVDGINGWWLCLLHGRQGIVPGNRLKIVPSYNLDNVDKKPNRGSYSTDDLSDSFDGGSFSDGQLHQSPDYDIPPEPVKANHGEIIDYPTPGNVNVTSYHNPEEVYDFPKADFDLVYDTPKTDQLVGEEMYDIPPTASDGQKGMGSAEIYDIPSTIRGVNGYQNQGHPRTPEYQNTKSRGVSMHEYQNLQTDFDALPRDPNTLIQIGAPVSEDIYDFPKSKPTGGQEIYAFPPRSPKIKSQAQYSTPKKGPSNTSVNNNLSPTQEIYDTPPKTSNQEIYDIPPSQSNNEIYDIPPNQQSNNSPAPRQEIYDLPPPADFRDDNSSSSAIPGSVDSLLENLYDYAPSDPKKMLAINNNRNVSRGSPVPSNVSTEIYDIPPNLKQTPSHGMEIYDAPPVHRGGPAGKYGDDIYDTPPAVRNGLFVNNNHGNDIYDTPPIVRGMTTPSVNTGAEIYDIPPHMRGSSTPNNEVYDSPPVQCNTQRRPSAEPMSDGLETQDIYAVPQRHDVNKVMSDIGAAYGSHRRSRRNRNSNKVSTSMMDDDDYVDYADIYGKEPPGDMVKEINKSPDNSAPASPVKTRPRSKSALDQINMSAVKELKMSYQKAVERLSKLHLAVDTSITALCGFATGNWLAPSKLKTNIDAIKDMAGKVKLSLRLLSEFALSSIVNARKLPDNETLANQLKREIEPLLETYYKIKVCLLHLDEKQWQVPEVRIKPTEKFFATVNAIIILAQRVPDYCRNLVSSLQNSASHMFPNESKALQEQSKQVDENVKDLSDRMENLRARSSPVMSKSMRIKGEDKGKLKPIVGGSPQNDNGIPRNGNGGNSGPVDAKKIREILELDSRPLSTWQGEDYMPSEKPEGADMSPGTLKRKLQRSRRQVATSTLPRRPAVPPKPALPSNRRSMSNYSPDLTLPLASGRVDTLVTDFIGDDSRKKYASDPARSPSEPEPPSPMKMGGSCPALDDRDSFLPKQDPRTSATSTGTTASTGSSSDGGLDDSTDDPNFQKMASDPNLVARSSGTWSSFSRSSRHANVPVHLRAASLPWDTEKVSFASYEAEQAKNSFQTQSPKLSKLDHRDTEALEFFLRQVESQVILLREAVKNLTESVTNNEAPQMFVSHSKFVILTAHKVVHSGEEVTGRLLDKNVKSNIKDEMSQLAETIRNVVAATKQAAIDYPEQASMIEMMSTVLAVGEGVRSIHKEVKLALDL